MLNPLSQYLMISKLIALLGAVAIICWQSSQIHKWHKQSDGNAALAQSYKVQLDAISTHKNQQQSVTKDNLIIVQKSVQHAGDVAKKIEAAPPTRDCKTAPVIMGADL